ncbi:MAG TPA: acyl-CoA thioesterase domain-containing protein [Hyphomicrobiaceae bacterium]
MHYNREMKNDNAVSNESIRRHVLLCLAANRTPGFHYPGHLLGCTWPRVGDSDLEETLPDTPVARNVDGTINLAAFGVLLDTALATASRLKTEPGTRQATVHLHAQLTGVPMRGELRAHAHMHGRTADVAIPQSLTSATFYAGSEPVCRASATFVILPPPPAMTIGPLPWQRQDIATVKVPKAGELDEGERAALRACNAALRRADDEHSFIEHFWGGLPVPNANGARCTVKIGVHHSNRVGHVQGGLLVGLAAITARAAAPRHPQLSAIAAWFISPGQGRALKIVSKRFHEGRSFAAVRTEIRNTDGTRVLEVVSHHAA